jgi:hypothetical protein
MKLLTVEELLAMPDEPTTSPSPFDSTGAQYAFDSTSLGWAETCPRMYQYYMIEGWTRLHGNVHLEFGGLYATALERFHKAMAIGYSRDDALDLIITETLAATWDDENHRPKDWDHASKTRSNLLRTIIWYNDELYVQDQKTTASTVGPYWFNKFAPDTQMTGYTYAGNVLFQMPVKGVIIDAAQIAITFSRFERGFTFRTPAQLEEWRTDSLHHIAMIRRYTADGYFPQNRSSCDKYGGCAFRDVCARSPEVREQFLHADFEQTRRWNPLQPR